MTRILLAGHGSWAAGMKSGVEMVAGPQPAIKAVNFTGNTEQLAADLKAAASHGQDLLVLCDLAGGYPFQCAALQFHDRPQTVVAGGVSAPMVLELVLQLEKTPAELMKLAEEAGHKAIRFMTF